MEIEKTIIILCLIQCIISKLNLLQTNSEDLEERYLWELSQHQKYLGNYTISSGGSLEISLGYLIDKKVLEVSIIRAKDLPSPKKSRPEMFFFFVGQILVS